MVSLIVMILIQNLWWSLNVTPARFGLSKEGRYMGTILLRERILWLFFCVILFFILIKQGELSNKYCTLIRKVIINYRN
jgi:hypothetical protein